MVPTKKTKKGRASPQKTPQKAHQQNLQNSPTQTPNTSRKTPTSPKKDRPSTLKMVSSSISKLEGIINTFMEDETELGKESIAGALRQFTEALKDVSKHLYSEEDEKVELRKELDDEKDAQKQVNLRGRFMITSPPGHEDLVGNADRFKDDKTGEKIIKHVTELAMKKYKVEIPRQEISTCYALKKGGIVLGFWHQGKESAYQRLVSAIKSNKDVDKELNVYFNYMLTKTRNTLLFNVRKIKKDGGKITKFFTDEYGNITVMNENGDKERITYTLDKDKNIMKTMSVEELKGKYQ